MHHIKHGLYLCDNDEKLRTWSHTDHLWQSQSGPILESVHLTITLNIYEGNAEEQTDTLCLGFLICQVGITL